MDDSELTEQERNESPGPGLIVLGMHRSGTSAITGLLHLCGAWVGEQHELTEANIENPYGFWERRDLRRICDTLLHSAGADWWKVASFDPGTIPHAILAEQRKAFSSVVSNLNRHGPWVIKEPRLCLLVSLLRDYIRNPVCVHIFRDPLEVARSLQRRNGFGIAGGIALWETYNRWALDGSLSLPRVAVDHESLMTHPMETLAALASRIEALGFQSLEVPAEDRVREFIDVSLYRHRAAKNETRKYLSEPQRVLWRRMRCGEVLELKSSKAVSDVSRQNLQDLESTKRSLDHHREGLESYKGRAQALEDKLRAQEKAGQELAQTLEDKLRAQEKAGQELAQTLEGKLRAQEKTGHELKSALQAERKKAQAQEKKAQALEMRVVATRERVRRYRETVTARDAELARKSKELELRNTELAVRRNELAEKDESLAARDRRIRELLDSTSWRLTAPLRYVSRGIGTVRRSGVEALRSARRFAAGGSRRKRGSSALRAAPARGGDTRRRPREDVDWDGLADLIRAGRRKAERAGNNGEQACSGGWRRENQGQRHRVEPDAQRPGAGVPAGGRPATGLRRGDRGARILAVR